MATVGPKTGGFWLWRKQATASVLTALLPRALAAPLPLERPLRVGYLRFDRRVGEVLLQTPLYAAHKAARPLDTVVAVVHPRMARVLRGQDGIDELVPFSWRGFPLTAESRAWLAALRSLRLDVAVDCSDPTIFSVGHVVATRLTGAPHRVGFHRGPAEAHYTRTVPVPDPVHEASARAALLEPFGVRASPELRFTPHPATPVRVDGADVVARMAAEPGRHAVVCPGGRLAWRRGGAEHFGALAAAVLAAGRTAWLAPGPGEEPLCRDVAALAPGARLLPVTDLDQLGAVMRAAGVVACNNSGTMHLACAVGARTFALFVHMDPVRWGHPQPQHRMYVLDPAAPDATVRLVDAFRAFLEAA
ncbi:MAG: glycosyltransferase family 9 protein [Deltaproteobacteria bacterium]|nr:glycosyltransferase family 9 protein [Deltaproteobacteria bacterium]